MGFLKGIFFFAAQFAWQKNDGQMSFLLNYWWSVTTTPGPVGPVNFASAALGDSSLEYKGNLLEFLILEKDIYF